HMPASKSDTATPRVAARFDKDHGFVFINNYQRNYPLPARKNFQITLKTAAGEMKLPRDPTEIPSGAYVMWPVNLNLGGTVLEYSTAQLLCRLEELNTYVFFAWPGLPVEFAFDSAGDESVEAPHARIARENHLIRVDQIEPAEQNAIRIRRPGGQEIRVVLLSREMARDAWKTKLAGRERLLFSAADLYFTPNAVHLISTDPEKLDFKIFPKADSTPEGFAASGPLDLFEQYRAHIDPEKLSAKVEKLRDAELRPPVRMGQEVAEAPEAEAFKGAAEWSIQVPVIAHPTVRNVFLRICYVGDIARLYVDGRLITDDFYNGAPWQIALGQISGQAADPTLELQILPMRKDAPIYLPASGRISFPSSGQVAELKEVELVPEYQAVARFDK